MRRFIIVVLCCLMLATAVSAESYISELQTSTTVASSGTCEVTATLQLHLDELPDSLWFPLPKKAKDITVNGASVKTRTSGISRDVKLNDVISAAGNHTLVIRYSLPDAVKKSGGQLYLELEILSGFSYAIENMTFSITLPGEPERDPEFLSTYYQEDVESLLSYRFEGNTVTCSFTQPLKDHESLTMTLAVSEDMFPQPVYKRWSLSAVDVAMYICTALALVYWLLLLREAPIRRGLRPNGPAGVSAGEYPCILAGKGVDFTSTVISWAQMGYLLIQVDDNGRVLLHKRMDMGNERSAFENYYFRMLFNRRRTVDGTGYRYADLCRKASAAKPGVGLNFKKTIGNPYHFRILAAVVGVFAGIALASAMAADTMGRTLLSILFGTLGAVICWLIQEGPSCLHLRKKLPLYIAGGASLLWLLLSQWAGEPEVGFYLLLTQWLAGFAVAHGGRKTDQGRQMTRDILGLRRYCLSASREELQRLQNTNPEYFYSLAPYALAMGVDKSFARRFGKVKLPGCTFLTAGMDAHMTAAEWDQLLRSVVQTLDAMQTQQTLNRLRGRK